MKNPAHFAVPLGSVLILDGYHWKVVGKDGTGYAVEGQDDTQTAILTFDRVDDAIREMQCEVLTPAELEKQKALRAYTGGYDCIEQLPEDEQADVRARLALVLAMIKLEERGEKLTQRFLDRPEILSWLRREATEISGKKTLFRATRGGSVKAGMAMPQGRTLQKYLRLYRQYDNNPVVLMHREHLKGPQGEKRRRLDIFQERFIDYVLVHWLKPMKAKLAPLYRDAQHIFEWPAEAIAAGVRFPSITTIRTRLKHISQTAKTIGREGPRQAPNLKAAGSTDIRAREYGEQTETDEVCLSIFADASGKLRARSLHPDKVKEKLEKGEILRTWLHCMIDVATRMPLAWILAPNPSADHSLELFRMAMRDKSREVQRYGCQNEAAPPVRIRTNISDNGTAVRNTQVRTALLGAGITVIDGRTYHATDKPHIERFFGTMQWDLLNLLPGYCGSRPGELPGYNPVGKARLTPDELYGIITRYMIDEYPFKPHSGTGMFGATPRQKLDEVIKTYGAIKAPSANDRRLHLGMKAQSSVTSEGVKFENLPYNSTELQRFMDTRPDKRVTVHVDPDYPALASITLEGHPDVITARLRMTALQDLSLHEILEVMRSAVESDPHRSQFDDKVLKAARDRRVRESGFFAPSLEPSTYRPLEKLFNHAKALLSVECVPSDMRLDTVPPGQIMNREAYGPAINIDSAGRDDNSDRNSSELDAPVALFSPLKESKF